MEIMMNMREEYYAFCYADQNRMTGKKSLGFPSSESEGTFHRIQTYI